VLLAILFTGIMLLIPLFVTPGLTYDSLLYFFSQSISEMLGDGKTVIGITLFIILGVFGFFLLSSGKTLGRR